MSGAVFIPRKNLAGLLFSFDSREKTPVKERTSGWTRLPASIADVITHFAIAPVAMMSGWIHAPPRMLPRPVCAVAPACRNRHAR